jgi:hypothetical protein
VPEVPYSTVLLDLATTSTVSRTLIQENTVASFGGNDVWRIRPA